jgi:hypothetical protein
MGSPTGSVFISYRRGDAPFAAHALHCRLARRLAEHQIFMDVQGIGAGADFAEVIRDQITRCDALVALIGRNWLRATDRQGRRRLDLTDDLVRIEIASALRLEKRVIPVLVGVGAVVPAEQSLPDDLKPLVRRNAFRLTHEKFVDECSTLVREIEYAMIAGQGDRYARRMRGEGP